MVTTTSCSILSLLATLLISHAFAPVATFAPLSVLQKNTPSRLQSLPKDELIRLAEKFATNPTPDQLSPDFIFRGPVIGPLCKKDFVATLTSVGDITTAFPDYEANAFGFSSDDPIEPNRVWYFHRPRGTFTRAFIHPVVGKIEPTGVSYVGPPEARSVVFDDEGLVKYATVGYVADRFTGDNTGGRGAVFGAYAVMGQEIDGSVGSVTTVLLQKVAALLPEGMFPKSYSKIEDLPEWWKDRRMGAET